MARRRYVSTSISTDRRLAELGERAGPWAVVLYTWAIPHAGDDARLVADPEELLTTVAPNLALRGLVTVNDAARFIDAAVSLGLLERLPDNGIRFPLKWWYATQRGMLSRVMRSALPGSWLKIRRIVLLRDGEACARCGAVDHPQVDHVIPVVKGGTHDL